MNDELKFVTLKNMLSENDIKIYHEEISTYEKYKRIITHLLFTIPLIIGIGLILYGGSLLPFNEEIISLRYLPSIIPTTTVICTVAGILLSAYAGIFAQVFIDKVTKSFTGISEHEKLYMERTTDWYDELNEMMRFIKNRTIISLKCGLYECPANDDELIIAATGYDSTGLYGEKEISIRVNKELIQKNILADTYTLNFFDVSMIVPCDSTGTVKTLFYDNTEKSSEITSLTEEDTICKNEHI